ncbi:lipid II flippase MurJ [Plantactinospora sp. WMMB782]|uniref:lipid II flippase MurJ n=1 Tax=Plantactinospora sp. WMMB782 TaxID=3404121 RepID=UPI003B92C5DC
MTRIFFRLLLGGVTGKVLGLLREVLLAALFGAGRVVAANRVALTATLIPINFFTADALSAGFLPLYVQYRTERPAMALVLYRTVRSLLTAFSLLLAVALLLGRAAWVDLLAPGLDPETARIAATMLGIAALAVPCYVHYNLHTLVGLAHDDVRLINIRPSAQSLGLIAATLLAYLTGRVELLAWGFTVPYVLLWLFGIYWVRRRGYLAGVDGDPDARLPDGSGRRLALRMFWHRLRPLLLIPVILQGSIGVERAVGSLLGVEVVAATEYARFVVDSCMALLAAPLGLAGLASFARMEPGAVAGGLRRLLPPVLFVTVPLSLILCLNSTGIVTLLYARGEFDEQAVRISATLLLGFALGIWAQVIGYTLVKVLNARGRNFQVAIVMAISYTAAAGLNLLLFRHWGALTLGVAASVGGLLMFLVSARLLGVLGFSLKLAAALLPGTVAAGALGYLLAGPGLLRLVASCLGILLVWVGYAALLPGLRRTFLLGIWARLTGLAGRKSGV